MKEEEFLILCDFDENCAFVAQNTAQSFYWNNDRVAILKTVIYQKESNELKHRSLALLPDNINYDTISVNEFQKFITKYLKENIQ